MTGMWKAMVHIYAEKLPTRHNILKESENVSHKIDTVSLNLKSGYHTYSLPIHCFYGKKFQQNIK